MYRSRIGRGGAALPGFGINVLHSEDPHTDGLCLATHPAACVMVLTVRLDSRRAIGASYFFLPLRLLLLGGGGKDPHDQGEITEGVSGPRIKPLLGLNFLRRARGFCRLVLESPSKALCVLKGV